MKKVKKGDYGYIRYEKKKRLLITVALFLIPLAAFLAAFLITGTKKNIITVIAMVGCLPACRALVNMIMMWMQKPEKLNARLPWQIAMNCHMTQAI